MDYSMQKISPDEHNALTEENFNKIIEVFKSGHLAIFSDYDGTLTPIVEDPSKAIIAEENKEILAQIAEHTCFGVITGRQLSKIQEFLAINNCYFGASHGFDIYDPFTKLTVQPAAHLIGEIQALEEEVKQNVASRFEGTLVENSVFTLSVHYRHVKEEQHAELAEALKECVNQEKFKIGLGKKVFEVKPKMNWNKGEAYKYLYKLISEKSGCKDIVSVYFGDDTTDEDVFRAMRETNTGVGISVHQTGVKETWASFNLRNPSEVFNFLEKVMAVVRAGGIKKLPKIV